MKATLRIRVEKLETRLRPTHAAVVQVHETPEDLAQGLDLFDVALRQGLIPPEVLAGQRMLLLLPEKIQDIDTWMACGKSLEQWQAAHPGQKPGLRFVDDPPLARAKAAVLQILWPPVLAEGAPQTNGQVNGQAPKPQPTHPEPSRPEPTRPLPTGPVRCVRCFRPTQIRPGESTRKCDHCDF